MYVFDENDEYYRLPAGALEIPGTLTLRLKLKRGEASSPRVRLYLDGSEAKTTSLDYEGVTGAYDVFKCVLSIDSPGLYWYNFVIDSAYGVGFTIPEQSDGAFQLTAYAPAQSIPDWLWGGIIYHIFVDRFAQSGEEITRPGAIHRPDWGGCPYFLPDERGIVHNNDFFGGNLHGIIDKLPYLEEMGVSCIYLSPVFEAASNHKYDTGDFMKVDASFGGTGALEQLCSEAGARGIKVILDGVFNHVGSDSRYFNRYGRYDDLGAYQSKQSPYSDWFFFHEDGRYESWWGIELLPAIDKRSESYRNFICGEDGVIAHWMKKGVSGWRLDVVDELPDAILDPLCTTIHKGCSNALIVGEVWEDASNKIAYDVRRRYFQGGQLDSVTNYPLRSAIIACVKERDTAQLASTMAAICRNYPENVLHSLMNIIGTHDTMRILTALSDSDFPEGKSEMSHFHLSKEELLLAKKRLMMVSALQFTLPGVPCIYYGDEAGMEGGADPFNRRCYPWGDEDTELIAWYKGLSRLRRSNKCFSDGKYELLEARDGLFAFSRGVGADRVVTAVNVSDEDRDLSISEFNHDLLKDSPTDILTVKAGEAAIFAIR